MSDYIPFEIQQNIIKRLPVKSLIQFRSVSKAWKSHIDSSDFISYYNNNQQHLLVRYASFDKATGIRYVSIVDDDTFPQHKVSHPLPPVAEMLSHCHATGSSHGLLCLYNDYDALSGSGMVVLWNISIKRAVGIVVPNRKQFIFGSCLGFGVCPKSNDPKIVRIGCIYSGGERENIVEVFALSSGAWRCPYSSNLPRNSIEFIKFPTVIDGFLYWVATSKTIESVYNLIVSFDMTSEEFREVNLPPNLAHSDLSLSISKLNESLVVLEHNEFGMTFDVWMMEEVSKAFRKLYTIDIPDIYKRVFSRIHFVLGFRKSGEPIIEVEEHSCAKFQALNIAVYEPCSKKIVTIGMDERIWRYYAYPYDETLLLLDHPVQSCLFFERRNTAGVLIPL